MREAKSSDDSAAPTPGLGAAPAAGLADIINLTDRVQAAIGAGEWQHAAQIEEQRRHALEALLRQVAAGDVPEVGGDQLAALHRRGRHMIGEVHHHRERLLREASLVSTGRKAADEYESTALAK